MGALEAKIRDRIAAGGPITFEEFMEAALYDPDYGYYFSQEGVIGREGDYYTSSHLHPAFGAMIGKQLEEMWQTMGSPGHFTIVELAPGAGFLSKDLLDSIKSRPFFPNVEYLLVERNPAQKENQRKLLAGYSGKVRWAASLADVPEVTGCIFSNELLDAFPVHLVRMEDRLREVYVSVRDSRFTKIAGPLSSERLGEYFREFNITLEKGYETEVNLRIRDWVDSVADVLRTGFVLTIDYGYSARDYYSEERNKGTLLCYRSHQVNENPFENVGSQDITAHVNFSSVIKWGDAAGLKPVGYCSQGAFLVSLGIEKALGDDLSEKEYLFELARIKKLILPQGLGESHMVAAQYKGEGNPVLTGFSVSNRLRYL